MCNESFVSCTLKRKCCHFDKMFIIAVFITRKWCPFQCKSDRCSSVVGYICSTLSYETIMWQWSVKSSATRLFVQQIVQTNNKEWLKICTTGPWWRESMTRGQYYGKHFLKYRDIIIFFFYQTLMYQLFWVDQYNRFDFNSCMDRYLHYWVWNKIISSFPNYKVIFCEKLWFVFPDQRIILSKWSMISRETPRHFESECFYKRYYDPGGVMRAPLGKAHRPPRDLTVERLHTLRRGHYCTSKYIK